MYLAYVNRKKIFVSGCFDHLHSGHIAFLEEAATHGDLYVGLGSDETIYKLKNRETLYNEQERLYMMKAVRYVKDAWINKGSGTIDFIDELKEMKPDILFVNEDGDSDVKKELCRQYGIEMMVSKRIPKDMLPARSTTDLREKSIIPYRLDLAGGWLDQPYVSKHHPGSVITISIEPTIDFNDRSGMSSSTRKKAIEIWGYQLPDDEPEKIAKVLFSYENPPGKKEISGSQDSIGIVFPGLNKMDYNGEYWPHTITPCLNEKILSWIEDHLYFVPLSPRHGQYDVLANTSLTRGNAARLSDATDAAWDALQKLDLKAFGQYFRESFEAQLAMFPNMMNQEVEEVIDRYREETLGWKLSGAGGGGYLIFVSEKPIDAGIKIVIRRQATGDQGL